MKKISAMIGLVGMALLSGAGSAAQYTTWNFETNYGSVTAPQDVTACGSANTLACEVKLTIGGQLIKARAYATTSSSTSAATLVGATISNHSDSGLGISNSSGESPFIDNSGRYDVMIFEAPSADFSWSGVELGYVSPTGSDFQAWVGNAGGTNYDFTQMCLSTTSATCTSTNSITSQFASLGSFVNKSVDSMVDLNAGTKKGRYLVVSGQLSLGDGATDGFKIKAVKGTPEPQTLVLLAFGLFGMFAFSRRYSVRA